LTRFLDSGVLLTGWRGQPPLVDKARAIIADESVDFVTSENVRLELLPKPAYEKRRIETEFYNEHFAVAKGIEAFSAELGEAAFILAKKYGLAAGDALNIASAIRQKADEFLTSEAPGKPLFRVKELRVIARKMSTWSDADSSIRFSPL
jgi:predicted nucleic acid-binding protein